MFTKWLPFEQKLKKMFVHQPPPDALLPQKLIHEHFNASQVEYIAKGAYAYVFKVHTKEYGSEHPAIAVKFIIDQNLQLKEVLKKFNHPHIVKLLDAVYVGDVEAHTRNLCMVFEYYEFTLGSLVERYFKQVRPSEKLVKNVAYQLLSGLLCVQNDGVVHRDLHKGNVLARNFVLEKDLIELGITDFGSAIDIYASSIKAQVENRNLLWHPLDTYYSNSWDVFTAGLLLLYFCTGRVRDYTKSCTQDDTYRANVISELINIGYSEQLVSFIMRMLEMNVDRRPVPELLLKDPILEEFLPKPPVVEEKGVYTSAELTLPESQDEFIQARAIFTNPDTTTYEKIYTISVLSVQVEWIHEGNINISKEKYKKHFNVSRFLKKGDIADKSFVRYKLYKKYVPKFIVEFVTHETQKVYKCEKIDYTWKYLIEYGSGDDGEGWNGAPSDVIEVSSLPVDSALAFFQALLSKAKDDNLVNKCKHSLQ